MKTLRGMASAFCTAGVLLLSATASATPVLFSVTGTAFTNIGTGYGVDAPNENNGTLLDVRFSTSAFLTQNFSLNFVGDSKTFKFGTINMNEPNASNGISPAETDNLGVSALFTFATPSGMHTVAATGTATPGPFGDADRDFFIDWAPILVTFGNGGEFRIDLADMSFFDNNLTQDQMATITLTKDESVTNPNGDPLPEPSTIALLGLGLLGAACGRRKPGAGSA